MAEGGEDEDDGLAGVQGLPAGREDVDGAGAGGAQFGRQARFFLIRPQSEPATGVMPPDPGGEAFAERSAAVVEDNMRRPERRATAIAGRACQGPSLDGYAPPAAAGMAEDPTCGKRSTTATAFGATSLQAPQRTQSASSTCH